MLDKTEQEIMSTWVLKPEIPVVTIRCLAYNHEKYIAQCLEGFLMQETTFSFEVVVHDDASTDNTANVIREYEAKYPHIIRAVYEEENQYQKKDGSLARIMSGYMRGKYIAFCEGDDFWTDKEKLQLQFDSLEAHPECSFSTCLVQQCEEDGTLRPKTTPGERYHLSSVNGIISQRDFAMIHWGKDATYPFQTSSYFIRREAYFGSIPGLDQYLKRDRGIMLRAIFFGDLYYHNKVMSTWRRDVPGSWSRRFKKDESFKRMRLRTDDYLMDIHFDQCTKGKFRDIIFPSAIRRVLSIADNGVDYAADLLNMYIQLIGKEEFIKNKRLFLKQEPFKTRLKLNTLCHFPSFYICLEKKLHQSLKPENGG